MWNLEEVESNRTNQNLIVLNTIIIELKVIRQENYDKLKNRLLELLYITEMGSSWRPSYILILNIQIPKWVLLNMLIFRQYTIQLLLILWTRLSQVEFSCHKSWSAPIKPNQSEEKLYESISTVPSKKVMYSCKQAFPCQKEKENNK